MFTRTRKLLAMSLLGAFALIGFTGPEASAAPGDWARTDIHIDSFLHDGTSAFNIECSFSMRLAADFGGPDATLYQAGGGRCLLGPDTTPGLCSVGEVDCTEVETWVEGTGCDDIVHLFPAVGSDPSDNTLHTAFSMGGYQVTDYAGGCDPESACIKISGPAALNPFSTMTYDGCGSIALEPFVEDDTGCEFGTMQEASTAPLLTLEDVGGGAFDHKYFRRTEVNTASTEETGSWITYVVWDKLLEPVAGIPTATTPAVTLTVPVVWYRPVNDVAGVGNSSLPFGHLGLNVNAHLGSETWMIHEGLEQNPDLTGYTVQSAGILGVGRFYVEEWWNDDPLLLWALPRDNTATHEGVVGVNDPSRCAFYFGAKLWNNESVETDEPGGGLDEEIEPPEPPDDPPPLPPTDDDGGCSGLECLSGLLGWLKAIWDRLGAILGTIVGLPGKIATAILDGLTALFVPEDGFMEDAFAEVKQAWRDSGPGSFITGFSEMGVSFPSSGCGGIPVNFAVSSVAVDFNVGEACSGAAASAAATVKLVASASLVLFGGLACVRAIGAGFGWSPGVGKGDGA